MIYSSWDIEQNILQLVILGHFLPFYSPKKTPKIKILKNEKICWRYHFTHVYQNSKTHNIWCTVSEIRRETDRIFCILGYFLPFYQPPPTNDPENQNFETKMKKMPGDIILLYKHVYHKWRYNIWFVKYKVRQTEIFVSLGHFLPFQPLVNLENQNFNITKNTWRYYHFAHSTIQKIKILKNWKKRLEISFYSF